MDVKIIKASPMSSDSFSLLIFIWLFFSSKDSSINIISGFKFFSSFKNSDVLSKITVCMSDLTQAVSISLVTTEDREAINTLIFLPCNI
ncbi:MAG TPA: hypothetical protein ENI15_13060 [Spirochaetes bacterium]|nr:hypothetical protein [Spirochaetota bacterium]